MLWRRGCVKQSPSFCIRKHAPGAAVQLPTRGPFSFLSLPFLGRGGVSVADGGVVQHNPLVFAYASMPLELLCSSPQGGLFLGWHALGADAHLLTWGHILIKICFNYLAAFLRRISPIGHMLYLCSIYIVLEGHFFRRHMAVDKN